MKNFKKIFENNKGKEVQIFLNGYSFENFVYGTVEKVHNFSVWMREGFYVDYYTIASIKEGKELILERMADIRKTMNVNSSYEALESMEDELFELEEQLNDC